MINALTISACLMLALASCKKNMDVQPQQEDENSELTAKTESVSSFNFSQTLTYADGGDCALLHGLGLPNDYGIDFQSQNYNNYDAFVANNWTAGGYPFATRSLLKFSFANLPASCTAASLVRAKLQLHQYVNSSNGVPYSIQQSPNSAEIRRVLSPWTASTVTWNTQPSTTGLPTLPRNAVAVPQITTPFSGLQDNQLIDVTAIVRKMLATGQNYGFELRFPNGTENQPYKARWYGSFTAPNIADRPTLKLYWN